MKQTAIRVDETGAYLGVKRTKIFELLKQGRLTRVRVDGRTLITVESAERLMAESLAKGQS